MSAFYEATAATSGGTYRALMLADDTVAILEDGVPGIVDTLSGSYPDGTTVSPESLVRDLVWWIYEMRRGEEILNTSLQLRR